jgi:hypothetical protein
LAEGTILLILGVAAGGYLLWKFSHSGHKNHMEHGGYTHKKHHGGHHHGMNWVEHPHGRRHMKMHHIKNMIHQDILNRSRHPIETHRNVGRIMVKLDQYEVMLRPLLFKRLSGKMSEKEFHNHLRSIEDQVCDELQLPMKHDPHHIKKDFINHDGSTTDMDTGSRGIYGDMWLSPDHWRFKRHHWLSDRRCRPTIHDFSARQHLAAFTTAGDDDDIHHVNLYRGNFVGMARSNNVELADDYDFQHAPLPPLPVADIFSEDGGEPM